MSGSSSNKAAGGIKLVGLIAKAMLYQFKVTPAHKKLREKLDTLANGFPETKTRAELRVLAELFSREEAKLCLAFGDDYESAAQIAAKTGKASEDVRQRLERMSKRGLIYRIRRNDEAKYRLVPFIVGILEFQINNMTPTLGVNIGMMMQGGYSKTIFGKKLPHLRSIPINAEIVPKDKIMPFDDAEAIIKSRDRISICDCLCRTLAERMGDICKYPKDTCFQFNDWAEYYVENGLAQYITKEDAMEKLRRNEKLGLVNQVANSRDPEFMCSCCSCHCQVLANMWKYPGPAQDNLTNYICEWDADACTNCGVCAKRCPAGAHTFIEMKKEYSPEKCIGCGLCVTTCPSNACVLATRPDGDQYEPLDTLFETYKEMASER